MEKNPKFNIKLNNAVSSLRLKWLFLPKWSYIKVNHLWRQSASSFETKSSQGFGPLYQGHHLCAVCQRGSQWKCWWRTNGNCCWPGTPRALSNLGLLGLSTGVSAGLFSGDAQVRPCEGQYGTFLQEGELIRPWHFRGCYIHF